MTEKSLRERAEAFLIRDERVADFSMAEVDGHLKISIHGASDWFADRRAAAHAMLETKMLRQWQMVYDRSYRWDHNVRAPNFEAWISSFTGESIPTAAMQAWLDDVLAKLRAVPHARVLDIGCGVGLVLGSLASGGTAYDGVDFSDEAIGSLSAWIATHDDLRHVRLWQRGAHELHSLDTPPAEVAIINSVAQYFPDAAYLRHVLSAATDRLAPNGHIFLGDLRAAALLPMRATCAIAARASDDARVADVRSDAQAALNLAREFAIDAAFFERLGASMPRLARTRMMLKPAAVDHELSAYRYDAMLGLDGGQGQPAPKMEAHATESIVARLAGDRPEAIAVCGLANARLAYDFALMQGLQDAAPEASLSTVKAAASETARRRPGIEPDDLIRTAASLGYETDTRFTPFAADGRFDALLYRSGTDAAWPPGEENVPATNDPLGADLAVKLRRDLQLAVDDALGASHLARVELAPQC